MERFCYVHDVDGADCVAQLLGREPPLLGGLPPQSHIDLHLAVGKTCLHFDVVVELEVLVSRKGLFQLDLLCLVGSLHEAFLADRLVSEDQHIEDRDLVLVQFTLPLAFDTLPELGPPLVPGSPGVCLFNSDRHRILLEICCDFIVCLVGESPIQFFKVARLMGVEV